MIRRDGAREFFEAARGLVAPGEVIFLEDPVVASLLTGVTGRWCSSGILRDVRSAEGRAKPEECEFLALISGGLMGGGPGPGGPRRVGPFAKPQGFEKVFENSFGSLWKNGAPGSRREPAKAAIPLAGLLVIAGAGLFAGLLDFLLARGRNRARLIVAAGTLVAVSVCLAPLARTSVDEILHPPEAPPREADVPLGGPPPGFGPGGPGDPLPPDDIPENLRERYDRVHEAIFERLGAGEDPRSFWAPEDEMQFRDLLESGKPAEAEMLLERALERLRRTDSRTQGEQ